MVSKQAFRNNFNMNNKLLNQKNINTSTITGTNFLDDQRLKTFRYEKQKKLHFFEKTFYLCFHMFLLAFFEQEVFIYFKKKLHFFVKIRLKQKKASKSMMIFDFFATTFK